jgi:hypothetical protein
MEGDMKRRSVFKALMLSTAAAAMPTVGAASTLYFEDTDDDNTVISWNLDNVEENVALGPLPEDGFASVVYQGDPASADTNGRIFYDDVEAFEPGMVAINDAYSSGQGTFDGCIRASASDQCATGFRTGNRFKLQLTDTGSIDLHFDVPTFDPQTYEPDAEGNVPSGSFYDGSLYQVFGRAVNLTTQMLDSFVIELGYTVDGVFQRSGANDGLSFAQDLELGPNDVTAFTQYPFGLFGDSSTTKRHNIDGFFDDDRAGFNLDIGEDVLASDGFYGGDLGYDARFGYWLSQEMAPAGLLWDDDNDEDTDALVMAYLNDDGMWEALRTIGEDGGSLIATSILNDPLFFDDEDAAISYFEQLADNLIEDSSLLLETEDHIEDLANLNLNYGILLSEGFNADQFTLRFTSYAAPAPIPLPASALLLLAGVGTLGAMRRMRRREIA